MRILLVLAVALCVVALAGVPGTAAKSEKSGDTAGRVPVLVELFTSEGCSSCPPADTYLQKLDQQPVAGAEMIVLSEHVDYWNHIGWKDPYSARFYSDRQSVYARRFDLEGPYTPEMVVDGTSEFVGSDPELPRKAFDRELGVKKIPVRLSAISLAAARNTLQAHVETGAATADADVLVAIALNHAESQVLHGENGGRTLTHTAVVRSMTKIGTVARGQGFAKDLQIKLDVGVAADNLRVVAFVQQPHQGKVLGATVERITGK
jgi:hypothetical protein